MIEVTTTYSSGVESFPAAADYLIDGSGNLILSTGRCQPIAAFAAGKWLKVNVIPNRDARGRFAKASA